MRSLGCTAGIDGGPAELPTLREAKQIPCPEYSRCGARVQARYWGTLCLEGTGMDPTTCAFHGGAIDGIAPCDPATCPWNRTFEGSEQLRDSSALTPEAMLLLWHIETETSMWDAYHDTQTAPPRTPDQDWWTLFDLDAWVPQVEETRQISEGIYDVRRAAPADRYTVRMALHELTLARIITYDAAPGQPDKGRITVNTNTSEWVPLATPGEWATWTRQRESK